MVKNLILSIIALAILAGCSGKKDKTTEKTVEAVPVKVQKLEKTDIAKTLDYAANLQADKQVYYAPAASRRSTWKWAIASRRGSYSLKWIEPS